jgi:hypothetical protein
MVAYGFKQQFVAPIEDGTKPQTMRNERARHARPGEEVQLYYGMRTKQCRLIGRATCVAVTPVRLDLKRRTVKIEGRPTIHTKVGLDLFAVRDGFADFDALLAFWRKEHAAIEKWSGVLIEWRDLRVAA